MEYRMDPNRQPRFIIRSCFGETNAAFVASGSEACPGPLLGMQIQSCCPPSFLELACLQEGSLARQREACIRYRADAMCPAQCVQCRTARCMSGTETAETCWRS